MLQRSDKSDGGLGRLLRKAISEVDRCNNALKRAALGRILGAQRARAFEAKKEGI